MVFSTIASVLLAIILGAIYCDSVQYWVSRIITPIRGNSPLVGDWQLSYDREGENVTEKVRIHAAFADVAYGELQAKLLDGGTAVYRVRLECQFDDLYSVVLKPATRSHTEIGMGVIEVDFNARTANGKLVNISRERFEAGEKAQMREVAIEKIQGQGAL